jgi:hypothetical protein
MMDHFDAKRGMVKQLLDMLKAHASNEVSTGLQHPDGEGDMHGIQAERVEVLPEHEMDEPTPEHDVLTHELHTGGIVDKVSPTVPPTMDSKRGQPDKEGSAHEEASESEEERIAEGDITPMPGDKYPEAESEPPSMFASFLSRKKKK